jgi:predicted metalloprotease
MRWRTGRRSSNIEDRRGMGGGLGGRMRFPGGGMRFPGRVGIPGGRRAGVGGVGLIAIIVIVLLLAVDPSLLMQGESGRTSPYAPQGPGGAAEEELKEFVSVVLADTEDTWREQFRKLGATYEEPRLVLFSGGVDSACGYAQAAVGPFYCPGDRKVYLDLSFFDELARRFEAPGDFAGAYVVAHEVGHHVQNILGIMDQVDRARSRMVEVEANALSVRVELQADCFAGVWANNADRARNILESGDIEEGLAAAAAVGDDRLQRQGQGYVVPDSFTHGSAEQRVRWFQRGFASGEIDDCDTFNADRL